MWIWIAVGAAVLAAAVVVLRRRSVRRRRVHPYYVTAKKLRITWPPGYAEHRPIRMVRRPDALFLIEEFASRAAALDFLRRCEIREERIYVIAENPEGNLGRDLIMIFEEADGAPVEIGERSPLPAPRHSDEDCARCGYPVIPGALPELDGAATVRVAVALDGMARDGSGFRCADCGALGCAWCYRAVPQRTDGSGHADPRCWLCGGRVDVLVE
ncbi:hypothetical protein Val02_29640 [Virgisporangium aliadipatigenens]|uniref:Uncharacterized protein n=1 Tax=Virgisporangium aliadipatigenens TaxID=741659 RepID=A0A8J4DQT9_9ACTN|nr:hypothetical protein [Virgisporangium aliadipatigenens]GIJ46078.1 hypothetical protein Val02_29640 [Virgisporangium aliadipatigenens]